MSDAKTIVRRWLEEAYTQGRPEVLDEICADAYVEHDPAFPGGQLGREGIKQAIPAYKQAYPDLGFAIHDLIAEGDMAAVRWTISGTNLGEFRGHPATGKRGQADGMTLMRVRDGKAVEAHSFWDYRAFRQQVGVLPPDP
jgi:steroid delta-isomerase-like uncharacterized protein